MLAFSSSFLVSLSSLIIISSSFVRNDALLKFHSCTKCLIASKTRNFFHFSSRKKCSLLFSVVVMGQIGPVTRPKDSRSRNGLDDSLKVLVVVVKAIFYFLVLLLRRSSQRWRCGGLKKERKVFPLFSGWQTSKKGRRTDEGSKVKHFLTATSMKNAGHKTSVKCIPR